MASGRDSTLNEINSRLPNGLCESKTIKEDDKEIACRISFEEIIRDRSVWLGRQCHGWHVESDKYLERITKLARRIAVTMVLSLMMKILMVLNLLIIKDLLDVRGYGGYCMVLSI